MKYIYLNNAASGWPKANGVEKSIEDALNDPPFHPGRATSNKKDVLMECRCGLSNLLGVNDPSRIVLTAHATHALNLALFGFGLGNGSHVVTSVTEHNSVLRPLHHLQQRFPQLKITTIGLDSTGALDEGAFAESLKQQPTLVVLNHASNVTGRINDIPTLFAQAKAAGAATLLDAAQTLGCVPISAPNIHADTIAFTGHKGLHGPTGTGGLYVGPNIELEQCYVGGTGVRSDLLLHPPEMPMRLEAGTPNVHGFAGLSAALKWHARNGIQFAEKANAMADLLRSHLARIPKVFVFDAEIPAARTAVVSFRIDGWEIEELGYVLTESFGIIGRSGLHCAPFIHKAIGSAPNGTIRLSPSGFTTEEEIEITVRAVKKAAA